MRQRRYFWIGFPPQPANSIHTNTERKGKSEKGFHHQRFNSARIYLFIVKNRFLGCLFQALRQLAAVGNAHGQFQIINDDEAVAVTRYFVQRHDVRFVDAHEPVRRQTVLQFRGGDGSQVMLPGRGEFYAIAHTLRMDEFVRMDLYQFAIHLYGKGFIGLYEGVEQVGIFIGQRRAAKNRSMDLRKRGNSMGFNR